MISPERDPLLSITASAGSGKTFQLVHRYLALVARGVPPESILATTFSKKAAHEIFERLIGLLCHAARAPESAREIGDRIGIDAFSADSALVVLRKILLSQSQLLIGTLDSFAQMLGRLFHEEIGLVERWEIPDVVDSETLEEEALRRVVSEYSARKRGAVLSSMTTHDASRSVFSRLIRTVRNLRQYEERTPKSGWRWELGELLTDPLPIDRKEVFRGLQTLKVPLTGAGKPSALWQKAHTASLESFQRDDWTVFLSKGLPASLSKGSDTFGRMKIPEEWAMVYRQAIAFGLFRVASSLIEDTERVHELLSTFAQQLYTLQLERRSFGFDDVKLRLASALQDFDNIDLVYRLDRQVQHLLLDEFQDTTPTEWEILFPLVDEIAASPSIERTLFCVGDPKQAIYGWRGGTAKLFEVLQNQAPHIHRANLATSYRSSPVILQFVNDLFERLEALPCMGDHQAAVASWRQSFHSHSAADEGLLGQVRIQRVGEEEERAGLVAQQIQDLLEKNSQLQIAVLVRSNKEILPLVLALEQCTVAGRAIDVSAEGGNPLTDSPMVVSLLALLQIAVHPGDTRAWFHVANTPLNSLIESYNWNEVFEREQGSHAIRQRIATVGLSCFVQQCVSLFQPSANSRDEIRGEQLLELALKFDAQETSDLERFISRVRTLRIEDSRPGTVRIMTIHRSKGLEFDAVFLPNMGYSMGRLTDHSILVERGEKELSPNKALLYVDRHIRQHLPRVQAMYDEEVKERIKEELSVLYVALTRAKYGMTLLVNAKESRGLTAEKIFKEAFSVEEGDFKTGDGDWYAQPFSDSSVESDEDGTVKRVFPQVQFSEPERRVKFFQNATATDTTPVVSFGQSRGKFVHRFFEELEWIEDGIPPLESVVDLRRKEESEDYSQWYGEIQAALTSDPIKEYFSRDRYGDGAELHLFHELPFMFFENERIYRGVIDRLVIISNDGEERAEIIDIKSGYQFDLQDEQREKIHSQLSFYKRGIAHAFPKVAGNITAFACLTDRKEVITCC